MNNGRWALAYAVVVAGLAWSGAALGQPKGAPATIRVVTPPLVNYTPLLVARDKGWFEAENLAVSWSTVTQTAVAIEAVYGGSVEFGGGGVLEPMIARGNGLDLMLAVPTARIRRAPPDNSALVVRADGDIKRAADLTGKKVSVGLINSINHVHFVEWLRKSGVDAKSVQLQEIPFPQMADALFQSRLDAVWAVEPFLTIMMKSGKARVLAYPYLDNLPGMDITAFFAKETWLKANADVAQRFKRAYQRAVTYLNDANKEERDGWVAKFTGVKPELVAEMTLPEFSTEFSVPSLKANMELAVAQRLVKPFEVDTMVWKP
ncbi:MAG TPA: ABC transporter substrate-binding protein [Xanthobacteraceae bacterium]|nr:ABC transporter substrate-binding protein [Xanthobacteraceae bacterium]